MNLIFECNALIKPNNTRIVMDFAHIIYTYILYRLNTTIQNNICIDQ